MDLCGVGVSARLGRREKGKTDLAGKEEEAESDAVPEESQLKFSYGAKIRLPKMERVCKPKIRTEADKG